MLISRTRALVFLLDSPAPQIYPFPYTTLFRSPPVPGPIAPAAPSARRAPAPARRAPRAPAAGARDARRAGAGARRDRKSTRLNSSHVEISYAVFCLKKKKTTQSDSQQTRKQTH